MGLFQELLGCAALLLVVTNEILLGFSYVRQLCDCTRFVITCGQNGLLDATSYYVHAFSGDSWGLHGFVGYGLVLNGQFIYVMVYDG
eukprot:gene2807-1792_t